MANAVPGWYGKEPKASIERLAAAFSSLVLDGIRRKGKRR
jgi:hypothetical protein